MLQRLVLNEELGFSLSSEVTWLLWWHWNSTGKMSLAQNKGPARGNQLIQQHRKIHLNKISWTGLQIWLEQVF